MTHSYNIKLKNLRKENTVDDKFGVNFTFFSYPNAKGGGGVGHICIDLDFWPFFKPDRKGGV